MSPLEIDFRDPSQGLIDLKLYRNVDLTTEYLSENVSVRLFYSRILAAEFNHFYFLLFRHLAFDFDRNVHCF